MLGRPSSLLLSFSPFSPLFSDTTTTVAIGGGGGGGEGGGERQRYAHVTFFWQNHLGIKRQGRRGGGRGAFVFFLLPLGAATRDDTERTCDTAVRRQCCERSFGPPRIPLVRYSPFLPPPPSSLTTLSLPPPRPPPTFVAWSSRTLSLPSSSIPWHGICRAMDGK